MMSAAETDSWVPDACTLPSAQQPLRLAEFDDFFATSVQSVDRLGPGRVRLVLEPSAGTAARAADLTFRETGCCSFFDFTLQMSGGALALLIEVRPGHADVLDALTERALSDSHRE